MYVPRRLGKARRKVDPKGFMTIFPDDGKKAAGSAADFQHVGVFWQKWRDVFAKTPSCLMNTRLLVLLVVDVGRAGLSAASLIFIRVIPFGQGFSRDLRRL